jgi:hydroxymethylglutaryl-CoA lyase
MAGAAEVFAALDQTSAVRWWALVPNQRGAELAVAAGARHLTITVSASDAYSQKNTGMSTTEALARVGDIAQASGPETTLDTVISCAFGSPFGDVAGVGDVASVVEQVRGAIDGDITLADTTGAATPRRIRQVLAAVGSDVGLHLHDSRGTALANALAAYDVGVRRFDCSVGGLGGSPFAPGAGGNLATEDLVLVLDDMGIDTGISLDRLLDICRTVEALVGHPLASRTSAAGALPPLAPL